MRLSCHLLMHWLSLSFINFFSVLLWRGCQEGRREDKLGWDRDHLPWEPCPLRQGSGGSRYFRVLSQKTAGFLRGNQRMWAYSDISLPGTRNRQ